MQGKKTTAVFFIILCGIQLYGQSITSTSIIDIDHNFRSSEAVYVFAHHPINLFDDSSDTVWRSNGTTHSLHVFFSSKITIDEIVFHLPPFSPRPEITEVKLKHIGRDKIDKKAELGSASYGNNTLVIKFSGPRVEDYFKFWFRVKQGSKDFFTAHTIELKLYGKPVEIDTSPFYENTDLY